jgi:hypothetical protein
MNKIRDKKIFIITLVVFIVTCITTSVAFGYTVKSGDTLYKIGKSSGVTVNSLKQANGLKSDIIYPGQVLSIPENQAEPLSDILKAKGITNPSSKLKIMIDKSEHVMNIYWGSTFLKTYHVDIGLAGLGDKQIEGDYKTPEGTFYIAEKSVLSPADQYLGTRWMRLSYPNIEDADRGLKQGLINQSTHDKILYAINNKLIPPQNTALGGAIGVHGGTVPAFGKDWTWGCVGLTSGDVQDFYNFTKVGTPVIIQK